MAGGGSIARLLKNHRGAKNRKQPPPLTEAEILAWADTHCQHTGSWPHAKSGQIADSLGDTWAAVDTALTRGTRQLPGGSSLARLLAANRGVLHRAERPKFTVAQILSWADAFFARTGKWPNSESGPILESPLDTWRAVNNALKNNRRGLTVGMWLAPLLAQERGMRNHQDLPRFSRKQIIRWAKAYRQRTGQWPTTNAGPILEAPKETWAAVDAALIQGGRGLDRAGSSLAKLLAQAVGKVNIQALPLLSRKKILGWPDAHHQRTGVWPNTGSGAVADALGERWDLIDNALRIGHRGLAGGSSLLQLLTKKRGARNTANLPPFTAEEIRAWARLHCERAGAWPKYDSGPIVDAPGETWGAVQNALYYGRRSLPGGSSLAKLLK